VRMVRLLLGTAQPSSRASKSDKKNAPTRRTKVAPKRSRPRS
jgi:hypothetical protein